MIKEKTKQMQAGIKHISEANNFLEEEYSKIKDDKLIRSVLALLLVNSNLPENLQYLYGKDLLIIVYTAYLIGKYDALNKGEK